MKKTGKKMGIVLIFIVCFALTLVLPKAVNQFYDGHLQDNVSYLDEKKEAVLGGNTQSGYSTPEIILAINSAVREYGGYEEQYFPFLYETENERTVEMEQAWETENVNDDNELQYSEDTETESTGQVKMEELFTQSAEDFLKLNPDVIQRLKEQLQQHVKSGLYEKIPDIISRQSMNDTDYIYLYYESFGDEEVISTMLWKMRFIDDEGALAVVVNPYDYSIFALNYSDYEGMDIADFAAEAYMKRDDTALMTEEYNQLAENYGASSVSNETEWSDIFLAENREILSLGSIGLYLFYGTLNYQQGDQEEEVPFINILRTGTSVPEFIYGPAFCLDFLKPWY